MVGLETLKKVGIGTLAKAKDLFVDARSELKEHVWNPLSPVDSAEEIQQQHQQSLLPEEIETIQKDQAMRQGMIKIGDSYVDPLFSGGMKRIVGGVVKKAAPKVFKGFSDLSTHVLDKLKGVGETSEKFILDTMQNVKGKLGIKQPEQNIYINALFDTVQGGRVNANDFANRVKQDLLPLTFKNAKESKPGIAIPLGEETLYKGVSLPASEKGNVLNYSEHIFESPIETSAGYTHFKSRTDNYFGHTRIEDMADNSTRRVIEVQSDLFQKGNLEREGYNYAKMEYDSPNEMPESFILRNKELEKLNPYKDIWHERLIREEVKQAAVDGKTKLQFPVGETAMKIEGLGQDVNNFRILYEDIETPAGMRPSGSKALTPDNIEVGARLSQNDGMEEWIVTDVLGDGRFKAITKYNMDSYEKIPTGHSDDIARYKENDKETFDISGKVDKSNPIYQFYESEVGKYLQKKYNATKFKDEQGVEWWQLNVDPSVAKQPVKAFGAGLLPGIKSIFTDTEETKQYDGFKTETKYPSLLKQLRGEPAIDYKRIENEEQNIDSESSPKVSKTLSDIHGPYHELDDGTTVRPVREKLKSAIDSAYQSTPSTDKGVIEAILMKESSMGTNSSNKNPDIGKYAWLVGFTKIAKQELIRNGFNPDLDTPEGAIEAMARYWDLKDDNYDSPMDAYNHWYSSGKLTPEQLQEFGTMVEYYS